MSTQTTELTIDTVLQKYHQKFDDSKIRKLLEELSDAMYARSSFFEKIDDGESQELADKMDDYWRPLDDLKNSSEMHDEILDKLESDVTGMSRCNCCERISTLQSHVLSSALSQNVYLVDICEKCSVKDHLVMNSKRKIEIDTIVPSDLSDDEKQKMIQYQKSLVEKTESTN